MSCNFEHTNIDTLFGVEPVAHADLPKICTCGAPLTYAATVVFIKETERTPQTSVIVEEEAVVWVSADSILTA